MIPIANKLQTTQEYYFSKKLREIRQRNAQGADILNLGIGSPDLQPPEAVVKTLLSAAATPGCHAYQPYTGILPLRQAMADWYERLFGVGLDPAKEVLPLMGSKAGIMHISMAFLNPGDQVLVPDPGYPTYRSVTELVGGQAVTYSLDETTHWLPDLDCPQPARLEPRENYVGELSAHAFRHSCQQRIVRRPHPFWPTA